jgi:diguanylate cyclase (GGDEF)-like protein
MAGFGKVGYTGTMKARLIVIMAWCLLFAIPFGCLFFMDYHPGGFLFSLMVTVISFMTIQILSWLYLTEREKRTRTSRTDDLTRIRNKLGFIEGIRHEMELVHRYGGDLGLILFEIDNFKLFKEKYGHGEADDLLAGLTEFLAGTIRSSDLFARFGGEEFVVVLTRCGAGDALKRAEKLGTTVEGAIVSEKTQVTLSLGVTCYKPGETLDELVDRARTGLIKAREDGRNCARLAI